MIIITSENNGTPIAGLKYKMKPGIDAVLVSPYDFTEEDIQSSIGHVMNIATTTSPFTVTWDISTSLLLFPAMVKANNKSITVMTLFDTGAVRTCISKRLASELNLNPIGRGIISSASGDMESNKYKIDIDMAENMIVNDIEVYESNTHNHGIDLAIGMDIIQQGDLVVSNYNNRTKLYFRIPSRKSIDYNFDDD